MSGDEIELRSVWQQHIGRDDRADAWFESVVARHREPHRRYHGLRHVRWVVHHVLHLGEHVALGDLPAVVAAAFFHDAVYEPTRSDNEEASAALAARALGELSWQADRVARVAAMITATAHVADQAVADTATDNETHIDTAILLAADLAVLATEPARYLDYVSGVREEYGHVSDDSWQLGRAAVLRAFLDRSHIYDPRVGADQWERRARANITAELAELQRR